MNIKRQFNQSTILSISTKRTSTTSHPGTQIWRG